MEPARTAPEPAAPPRTIAEPAKADTAEEPARTAKAGVPLRPLANPARVAKAEPRSSLQRVVGLVRAVAPVVQKVLPLLDGNVALAAANLLTGRPEAPRVDLEPIENAVMKMRKEHLELRMGLADQSAALKRIADQVGTVRDSTERNALEAKELAREIHRLRARVSTFAWLGLGLLAVSLLVNIVLLVRLQHLVH